MPSCSTRLRMWAIIITPLRVAMPKSVIKPMIEAIDSTPPDRYTPAVPPMIDSGRLSMIRNASRAEWKATKSSKKKPTVTSAPSTSSVREDSAAHFFDHTLEIAAGNVGHHHYLALHVLAVDEIRPTIIANLGQRRQRQT